MLSTNISLSYDMLSIHSADSFRLGHSSSIPPALLQILALCFEGYPEGNLLLLQRSSGPLRQRIFCPPPFFSSRILPFENLFIEVIEIVALEGRPCFYEINEGDSGGLI
jgi:hypothetical protein